MDTFKPRLSILPESQQRVWPRLRVFNDSFVLYGGTAVSLRCGHRISVDFDLFSSRSFDPADLSEDIVNEGRPLQSAPNNYSFLIESPDPVKISLFGSLKMGRVGEPELTADGVLYVASPVDLLAAKLKVVFQRAEKKDYEDIAVLLESGLELEEGLGAAKTLYGKNFNLALALKTLTFYGDGDLPELDEFTREILIKAVKNCRNIPEVPKISRTLL
jgi:hypothetical protein